MANKSVPYTIIWQWTDEEERAAAPFTEYVDKATTAERAIGKLYAGLGEEYGDFSKAQVMILAAFPTVSWLPQFQQPDA